MESLAKLGFVVVAVLFTFVGCIPFPVARQQTYVLDKDCLFLVDAGSKAPISRALLLEVCIVDRGFVEGNDDNRIRCVKRAFVFHSGDRCLMGRDKNKGLGFAAPFVVGGYCWGYETSDHLVFAPGYRGAFLLASLGEKGEKQERGLVAITRDEALAELDWLNGVAERGEIASEEIQRMDAPAAVDERDAEIIKCPSWPIQVRLKARDRRVIEDFVREAKAELEKEQ